MKREEISKLLHGTMYTDSEVDMLVEVPQLSGRDMMKIRDIKKRYRGAMITRIGPASPEWDLGKR